jgi:two-component system chemotaxis response regulator CheB
MSNARKIKVLIIDDSAIVRKILSEAVNSQTDMEVVGTAPDAFVARDKILALNPDVLTLDIEMPRMDGLSFLKRLMHFHPMPVIVISSLTQSSCEISLEAMRIGAVDAMGKPGGPYSIGELSESLPAKLRAAAAARVAAPDETPAIQKPAPAMPLNSNSSFNPATIIAIGASTGGTEAIHKVLMQLPANIPGMVVTQHIPKHFSSAFAQRLNRECAFEVKEAVDGDEVGPGRALIAPGEFHLVLKKVGTSYRVHLQDGPKVCYQRPAVDVMFASVAAAAKDTAIGVLLTGMGADGAQGLLSMRKAGASTIAQDEATCVVYGMPREAARMGAVQNVLPLLSIPSAIVAECMQQSRR